MPPLPGKEIREKFAPLLKKKAVWVVILIVLAFVGTLVYRQFSPRFPSPQIATSWQVPSVLGVGGKEEQIANANATEGINTLKIQSEDQLKAVNDLIRMNQDLSEQNKLLSGQIDNLNTNLESKVNEKLDEAMGRIEEKLQGILPSAGTGPAQPAFARLKVLHVGPSTPTPASTRNVFLPAGSFVKGTLLTGVFAPGDRSNPLPVLFSVDEAFYGPARTRIPLKGLLGIGKAVADVNSRRAIIQVQKLSYVCPNGKNWEKDVPGYICGADGVLGLEGKVIRATGKAFAGSFISGFLSGAAEALAMGETTTSAVAGGAISAVTGDVGKFAAFSGLSAAAGKLSDYYAKMLDEIITAVSVTKGQKLTIVIQQGVEIEGYTAPANNSASLNY